MCNRDDVVSVLIECYSPVIPLDLWNPGHTYDINLVGGDGRAGNIPTFAGPGLT